MTRFAIRWAAFVLLVGLAVRVVIARSLAADPEVSAGPLWAAFAAGTWHDVLAALLLAGPLALALLAGGRVARTALFAVTFVVLLVAVAELLFWSEFDSRLNRLVFHYLLFPREVVSFLEDQFFLSLYLVPALVVVWACHAWLARALPPAAGRRARAGLFIVAGLSAVAYVAAEPWPVSQSRRVNEMAGNGYLGVLHAARVDVTRWQGEYWAPPGPARTAARDTRAREPLPVRHVILVIEESFAGELWLDPALRGRYLPEFTALAESGLLFERVYATGTRTTRGLEALLNAYPPLPGIATNQRAGFETLPSLPRALARQGFHNVFVYGGWPGFSNFFPYWRALGFEELTSRDDFADSSYQTSWGVADEHVFERILDDMDGLHATRERVFITTLTVSHHRPYDFPAGRVPFAADARRSEHAMAYADWALGAFLRAARAKPWFDDTLFVIVADHGPRVSGHAPIPAAAFRVPLLFYSPAHLGRGRVTTFGSSMSFGLTLLDLLGLPDTENLYGASLLAGDGPVPVEHDYHVGMVDVRGMTVLHRGGGLSGWRWIGDRLVLDQADVELAAGAAALFADAHRRFYRATRP